MRVCKSPFQSYKLKAILLATKCQKLNLFLRDERNKNSRNYQSEGHVGGNSSASDDDEINSNTCASQVADNAKQTCSASYLKLKDDSKDKKPSDEPDEISTAEGDPMITGLGPLTWKFCAMYSWCLGVLNLGSRVFCLRKINWIGMDVPYVCVCYVRIVTKIYEQWLICNFFQRLLRERFSTRYIPMP